MRNHRWRLEQLKFADRPAWLDLRTAPKSKTATAKTTTAAPKTFIRCRYLDAHKLRLNRLEEDLRLNTGPVTFRNGFAPLFAIG